MSIERFKIVNDDGSTNKSEYERCIQFLNDYIEGKVKVYQKLDWDNPYEVDMTRELPANVLLKEVKVDVDVGGLLNNGGFMKVSSSSLTP